jgi:hypothetical protein
MAMEPVGHIAGLPQRLLALFLLSWPFLSAFSLAVLLQMGVAIICWLFDMCNIISRITYLFKIDEKRVNITSKTNLID